VEAALRSLVEAALRSLARPDLRLWNECALFHFLLAKHPLA